MDDSWIPRAVENRDARLWEQECKEDDDETPDPEMGDDEMGDALDD